MQTVKIAILGGGLSGLTLGYLLSQKAVDFEILEKEKNCGGLLRTLCAEGFTFDYGGSHVIFSKDKEVLNFMLSLLGNNKIKNKRNAKVLYKGHYVKYPFENGLADLPKKENFECCITSSKTYSIKKRENCKNQRPSNNGATIPSARE